MNQRYCRCSRVAGVRRGSGAIFIYVTVFMIAMIAMVSLAVDLGRAQLAKTELRAAVDAAARYGMTGLPLGVTEVKNRVVAAAAQNKVDGRALTIDPNNDIEFGSWNSTTGVFTVATGTAQASATSIRVTGRLNTSRGTAVPLMMGAILGRRTVDMTASAVAGGGQGADIVILQDITVSFTDELPDAKVGDQAVVNSLYNNGAGTSRIGVLVFTGWGKTLRSFTPVGSNYTTLTNTISSIKVAGSSGMPVASGTDIAAGFDEAIKNFTASGYTASPGGKVIILISDGAPEQNSGGSHPTYTNSQLLTLARQRADQLWALNVHIYVVFFDRNNDATARSNLNSLKRGNGDFVAVSNPSDLPTALAEVAKRLPIQLLR
jgi:Flp pilus assembly protein TadG